jgi:hypothetical protein
VSAFRLDCTTSSNGFYSPASTVVTSVTQNSDGSLNIETGDLATTCTVGTLP